MSRLSAISIDVDSLRFYRQIHGLGPDTPDQVEGDPIYTVAMRRFWDLLEQSGVPATLFLIGADAAVHPSAFSRREESGSEIASHSHTHDYRLSRRSVSTIREDLRQADEVLRKLNDGRALAGFRAPGYNVSKALLEAVLELGYSYDSSLLPSPWYFGARSVAISAYQVLRRPSASITGGPRQFLGPLAPYRTSAERPWRPSAGPLVELPMACEPLTRIPLIGTSWILFPKRLRQALLKSALARLDAFVFELHAIDLLDRTDSPELSELAKSQADLRIPAATKIAAFAELFHRLSDETEVCTLAEISARTS